MNGLDLFVEVIFLLCPLHLALDSALNRPVYLKLLDFYIEQIRESLTSLDGVEYLDQFLLFFYRQREVGTYRVAQTADVIHPDRSQNLLVIDVLAQLDVLLEKLANPGNEVVVSGESLVSERR